MESNGHYIYVMFGVLELMRGLLAAKVADVVIQAEQEVEEAGKGGCIS